MAVSRRIVLVSLLGLAACDEPPPPRGDQIAVADALGGEAAAVAGYERALAVPELRFPRDHGAHSGFRTEWWYVTGNLATREGRRFGVQLVFFRQALRPPGGPVRNGSLAAEQLVLAHAAVADVDGGRFLHEERTSRIAAGLAGVTDATATAAGQPFAVHCGDWSARAQAGGDGLLPLDLAADGADFAFDLQLAPGKPIVLQGDRGLSQKSDEPGNASIYYSLTRLPIRGRIVFGERTHDVQGEAWLDREWSTSALGKDQVGWDWFSLQLDDGCEVMWYRLRRRDGAADRWSRGCVVDRDGTTLPLRVEDVTATPEGAWRAADGRAAYPARWRLQAVGAAPFDLVIEPLLADQELRVLVRYWEGAVAVRGTHRGRAVQGRGYLEMTGYTLR